MLLSTLPTKIGVGRTLTLEESIQLSLENNAALRSSREASKGAEEEVVIARSALLPTLKLKAGYTIADKSERMILDSKTFMPNEPSQKSIYSVGEKDSYAIGVALRQPLFTGGSLINAHQFAKHESASVGYSYSRQCALVVFQVKTAFNESLIAARQITVAEIAVRAAEERLKVVVARKEESYSDNEDVLRREADLALAQARLIKTRNRSMTLLGKLRQLTGTKPDEEIIIVGKLVKLKIVAGMEELTTMALERREDILSANEKITAAQSGIQMARGSYWPQVFVEGQYLRRKETSLVIPELWSLTVQAEWSLFEWGKTTALVRKTMAKQSQLTLAKDDLSRSARLEVEETWREVLEQQSMVIAYEKVLKAIEEGFSKTVKKFLEDTVKFDDVITAETATWQAYENYSASAVALSNAFAALELSVSSNLERQMIAEDLYRPDFESYASRINKHYSKKNWKK